MKYGDYFYQNIFNNMIMKFVKFLKLLNKKIDRYDRMFHTNPFISSRYNITVVWTENKGYDDDFPLKYTR